MRSSIFSSGTTTNNATTPGTSSTSKISSPNPRKSAYHLTPTSSASTSNTTTFKRYRSSSPYINNPKPRTPNSSALLGKTPKTSTWNLDDLLSSYQDSGILPPILSPTLPNEETPIHKSLSTSNIEPGKLSLDSDSDVEDKPKSNINLYEKYDKEESIPRLLSPTLPSLFDTPISTPKPSNNSSTFTNKRTSTSTIKWINKMNDTNKPKFLLRIMFDNKVKYKRSMQKGSTKEVTTSPKLNGLGISITKRKEEVKESNKVDPKKKKKKPVEEPKRKTEQIPVEKEETKKRIAEEPKRKIESALIDKEKRTEQPPVESKNKSNELADKEKALKELEVQLQIKQQQLQELQNKLSQQSQPDNDQQRKREQLKQLTQDVIMREQSQPLEDRIKIKSPEQSSNLSKSQREDIKQSLQTKKNHWLQLSKSTKLKCESCNDEFLSIIINIDSILLKIVSFDFDERSKIISQVLPSERSWKLLDEEINELIFKIEKYSKFTKDKIILEFLKILNCILFQARAIILKRINSLLTNVIESYIKKDDAKVNGKIIELQQLALANNNLIQEHFMNSRPTFINSSIPLRFPITWFNKSLNLEIPQREYNLNKFDNDIKPTNQVYYLPFGIYTNMNEFTAFLYNIMNEFIDIYNKYNVNNPISYKLQSGLA
ncbi:hypothetical protein JA1_002128 [Spathaspora sp. JA1]|nr:hypothetical protein JA1_002128 [Spathaspora sp. JA1]